MTRPLAAGCHYGKSLKFTSTGVALPMVFMMMLCSAVLGRQTQMFTTLHTSRGGEGEGAFRSHLFEKLAVQNRSSAFAETGKTMRFIKQVSGSLQPDTAAQPAATGTASPAAGPSPQALEDAAVTWVHTMLAKHGEMLTSPAPKDCPSDGEFGGFGCALVRADGSQWCTCPAGAYSLYTCYQPMFDKASDPLLMRAFVAGECGASRWIYDIMCGVIGLLCGCICCGGGSKSRAQAAAAGNRSPRVQHRTHHSHHHH